MGTTMPALTVALVCVTGTLFAPVLSQRVLARSRRSSSSGRSGWPTRSGGASDGKLATAADALAELLALLARRPHGHRSVTASRLTRIIDTGLLPAELAEMAVYYRAKAYRDLGQSDASHDDIRLVADGGGRLAPDAARGLAHLARATGDFPTALSTAGALGWRGRGNRVLSDIHFAHGDMNQAATAFTAARTEASAPGGRGCWQPRRRQRGAVRSRPTGRASRNPACPGPRGSDL